MTTAAPARARLALPLAATAAAVGGLSEPSKMPWYGWSTPAASCVTGSKLRRVEGSVCHGCYAHKGNYNYPSVKGALKNRLDVYAENPEAWVVNMADAIAARAARFTPAPGDRWPAFRWHDSGDLQSAEHLADVARVASLTHRVRLATGRWGRVRHWLPTREYGFVTEFFEAGGELPSNLTVRLSAHMVDGVVPAKLAKRYGLTVSGVHKGDAPEAASECVAYQQGGQCRSCRQCWDPKTFHVSYPKH